MSFAADMRRFTIKVDSRRRDVYVSLATKVHESVKVGSPVTGAPGQPVDTGFLRNSWILAIGVLEAVISTNVEYAPGIEDGISQRWGTPMTVRSSVGGFHSVKLTIAGANSLLAEALRELGP